MSKVTHNDWILERLNTDSLLQLLCIPSIRQCVLLQLVAVEIMSSFTLTVGSHYIYRVLVGLAVRPFYEHTVPKYKRAAPIGRVHVHLVW